MIRSKLQHPEILEALGGAGHGSKVLIADGNYPFSTRAHPNARRVYLNLAPGIVTVTDVLQVLVDIVPIEHAQVMVTDTGEEPSIHQDFHSILPAGLELEKLRRYEFYDAILLDPDAALVIATGEQRIFANIILTIGVIPPTV